MARCTRFFGAVLLGLCASACSRTEQPADPSAATGAASTPAARVEETLGPELRRIGEALYAGDCPQYGRKLREEQEARLADPNLKRGERIDALESLASELVELGEVKRGIELTTEALALAREAGAPKRVKRLERQLALAWLREAENANCLARHNAECCILPARAGAVHQVREPAETARTLYRAILADTPEDLGVRWLVNVTTLLLGERVEDLPEAERLPAATFGSSAGEPLFRDVAATAGVATNNLAGGIAIEDYDGDGWLDLLTSTCDPLGPLHYFRNAGDGTFEDRSGPAGVEDQLGGLNLISGDYDGDGDHDALVLRGGWLLDHGRIPNSLLRNDGAARFADVTRSAGLAEPAYPTQTATFGDFDGDGALDLYVGNESRIEIEPEGTSDYPSQLFLNDGAGHYTDHAREAGVENDRYTKGVCAGDYDQDGDLDLYASNIGLNRLYRNDGTAHFEDVGAPAGVLRPANRSFACWFFDWDQDGWLDLWVNGYQGSIADLAARALGLPEKGERGCLYENRGDGRFEDITKRVGLDLPFLAMGANFCDVDGDGWLDMYQATGDPFLESLMPNVLLHNEQGQRYVDATAAYGLGHLQKGHGVGFGDFDHDGDEDLFHQLGGFVPVDAFPNALFENRSPAGHAWLELTLVGTHSNRAAVGARIEVHLVTPAGPRVLYRAAGCVSSYGGSPHRLELGLGDAQAIERIVVHWPRGGTQEFRDVPRDAWLVLEEGRAQAERRTLGTFRFTPDTQGSSVELPRR